MQILKRTIKWVLQLLAMAAAREVIQKGWELLKQIFKAFGEQ